MRTTRRRGDEGPADGDDSVPPIGRGAGSDDDSVPLIELGDDADDDSSVDQLAEDDDPPRSRPGARRPLSFPRRYLIGGAVGLLAVGFVAGMVVQRAGAPTPDDAVAGTTTTSATRPTAELMLPTPDGSSCRYVYGYRATGITTVCTGMLVGADFAAHGWRLNLSQDDGARIRVEADRSTAILGFSSISTIQVGTTLLVAGHTGDDGAQAATVVTIG